MCPIASQPHNGWLQSRARDPNPRRCYFYSGFKCGLIGITEYSFNRRSLIDSSVCYVLYSHYVAIVASRQSTNRATNRSSKAPWNSFFPGYRVLGNETRDPGSEIFCEVRFVYIWWLHTNVFERIGACEFAEFMNRLAPCTTNGVLRIFA